MDTYLGEIRMFAGDFAPSGWMFCNGQLLSVHQYTALFNVIGTRYGGDGVNNFALPDLRGRVPVSEDANHPVGEKGGVETVALTAAQLPVHSHEFIGSNMLANEAAPGNHLLASAPGAARYYNVQTPSTPLNAQAVSNSTGSGRAHTNMQPYFCIGFIIAVEGIDPIG